MIARIIKLALDNRALMLLLMLVLAAGGIYALGRIKLDALPNLSATQVIIDTKYPGQAPQVVQDQVTYPLTTIMSSVPSSTQVRGYSSFGESYVYVTFEAGTDLYWARSRVLEYLSQAQAQLPAGVTPTLGPDATGVGWVYEYALVDRTNQHDLAALTTLQNWFLKYQLQQVPGVSQVATIGGMVKQYQVVVNPDALRAYHLPLEKVRAAIESGNSEAGGSVIEMAEAEYMLLASGYIKGLHDLEQIPLGINQNGTPILLKDVAEVRYGPEARRGVADLNGQGEVVGGVVIMRDGANALKVIEAVKQKLQELKPSLPAGVELVATYDRSELIQRSVATLYRALIEELIIVILVCTLFLLHLRSSLVMLVSLPLGVLAAVLIMYLQGITANIMSLGGIALAIGAMTDAGIVMLENLHKHFERSPPTRANRWRIVSEAAVEVGPALFFSLVIVAVSFLPIFTLGDEEGRLFAPLAFTKTYAMASAAVIAVLLLPLLMGYFVRGRIRPEHQNPVSRALIAAYRPVIRWVERAPWLVVGGAAVLVLVTLWPASRLGSEFMPPLNEGTLLYMPSLNPGLSIGKAEQLLQQTNRLIKQLPEVATVFGKAGKADTATDPAPLNMFETTVTFKPQSAWRRGMTWERLRQQLNERLQLPGVTNVWVFPIRNRIDMTSTGIKTPVGIEISGPSLAVIQQLGERIEAILRPLSGTASVYADRTASGRYVDIDIDRAAAARYDLNIGDVQSVIRTAVGGMNVTETVQGLERFPVNLRYPRAWRDSLERLQELPLVTSAGATIPLSEVATLKIANGPDMIESVDTRPTGNVYVDISGRDLASYVQAAQAAIGRELQLPAGYTLSWVGQYQGLQRAEARLALIVPLTLFLVFLLLYLNFRSIAKTLIIFATLPLSLVGGVWLLWALHYNLSVAVYVGFIALAGIAAEIGVVMLVYLDGALKRRREQAGAEGRSLTLEDLRRGILEGAVLRVRPVIMTVAVIILSLLPVLLEQGAGSEVMHRIVAPMIGGMLSATVLALLVVPAVYYLWQCQKLK
ncbi:MAG: CusA/CzcA family heavy metal efflux RND transporter [Gammaproteobacteria bacterium]|nr:CusA/CzcA family heavy metal efflux RND transporter [Gammaproteobacteria bacterium]MBU6509002.1 CusA/CzcA family heavy metal efflux RND transporter [Gammaproteobacteria bacterium]MDE1983799.1 efflux RND transporter permease subunit [Gammaproteobacteria bacterium]MDE2108306.1 efflux RND transporter permease subunit [Gammaproteobacteria bacterium]